MNSTTSQKNPLAPNLYTYQYAYKGQPHEGTYTVSAYCEADAYLEVMRQLRQIFSTKVPESVNLIRTVECF